MASRGPTTWEQYERGASPARSGSMSGASVQESLQYGESAAGDDHGDGDLEPGYGRRR